MSNWCLLVVGVSRFCLGDSSVTQTLSPTVAALHELQQWEQQHHFLLVVLWLLLAQSKCMLVHCCCCCCCSWSGTAEIKAGSRQSPLVMSMASTEAGTAWVTADVLHLGVQACKRLELIAESDLDAHVTHYKDLRCRYCH